MQKIIVIIAMIFVAGSSHAQFSKASLQATGLTCAMCSNAINKALQAVPFVETVKSDIQNSAFAIVFKAGQPVSIDALKTAVVDAGFSIGRLTLTGTFDGQVVKNDEHIMIGADNFHFLAIKDQSLNGETTLTVVDKNFVTAKQFKKFSAATKMTCVQTGKAAACCTKDGIAGDARIYHVTI